MPQKMLSNRLFSRVRVFFSIDAYHLEFANTSFFNALPCESVFTSV